MDGLLSAADRRLQSAVGVLQFISHLQSHRDAGRVGLLRDARRQHRWNQPEGRCDGGMGRQRDDASAAHGQPAGLFDLREQCDPCRQYHAHAHSCVHELAYNLCLERLLQRYLATRDEDEEFGDFVDRHTKEDLAAMMQVEFAEDAGTPKVPVPHGDVPEI